MSDGSGTAELVWFKGIGWIEKQLEMGREYIIFGRPAFFNGLAQPRAPRGRIDPRAAEPPAAGVQGVYSTTEKLNNKRLGTKAIYNLVCNAWALAGERIAETLPQRILEEYRLRRCATRCTTSTFPKTTRGSKPPNCGSSSRNSSACSS